ncbi:MAG: NUDIX domain-containing protein [Thermomicrobiales bacterium]
MEAEQVTGSEQIYAGKVLTLRVDRVTLPSGRATTREVVEHPGAVAIVPLLPDGRAVLVRQYRHATGETLLEIPAGTRDVPGETPEATAARELGEETGYRATHLTQVLDFYTAPGFCTERMLVYLATGLSRGDQQLMDDEAIAVELVALDDVPALLARGELRDAKTIAGLLAARASLQSGSRAVGQ